MMGHCREAGEIPALSRNGKSVGVRLKVRLPAKRFVMLRVRLERYFGSTAAEPAVIARHPSALHIEIYLNSDLYIAG